MGQILCILLYCSSFYLFETLEGMGYHKIPPIYFPFPLKKKKEEYSHCFLEQEATCHQAARGGSHTQGRRKAFFFSAVWSTKPENEPQTLIGAGRQK